MQLECQTEELMRLQARYDDLDKMKSIIEAVNKLLHDDPKIDQSQKAKFILALFCFLM